MTATPGDDGNPTFDPGIVTKRMMEHWEKQFGDSDIDVAVATLGFQHHSISTTSLPSLPSHMSVSFWIHQHSLMTSRMKSFVPLFPHRVNGSA